VEGMMIEKIIKSNLSDEEKISLINEKITELENKILAHSIKLSQLIQMIKQPIQIKIEES
jgi:acyl carrier protein